MEQDDLQKQLESLWEKVQRKAGPHETGSWRAEKDFSQALGLAQSEMQTESLNLLRSRLEKEKNEWAKLVEAKEETIARLQKEIQEREERIENLKLKVQELQEGQSVLLQQSFSTIELQRRSLKLRVEQLEKETEIARSETLALQFALKEEKDLREKTKADWDEKEKNWILELEKRESETEQVKQDLFRKRQSELAELDRLEGNIKDLGKEILENKVAAEAEKTGLANLIAEKENQIEKMRQELEQLQAKMEREREERKLAAAERERESGQEKEDKKRLVEQLLSRENKIKEVEAAMQKMAEEILLREQFLQKKTQDVLLLEEALRKRREDWVESVQDQSGQQMSVSAKVVELLNKLETKIGTRPPPVLPTASGALGAQGALGAMVSPAQISAVLRSGSDAAKYSWLGKAAHFIQMKKGVLFLTAGLALFSTAALLLFFDGKGGKPTRAVNLLEEGNQLFSKGDLAGAVKPLEEAHKLAPENSIVKNSLTLVLGELAHQEFRDGKFEEALQHTQFLYELLPEDTDVLQLHNSILQALGRGGKKSPEKPQEKSLPPVPAEPAAQKADGAATADAVPPEQPAETP